jgi:uncharacterized protein (UPF0548 family)
MSRWRFGRGWSEADMRRYLAEVGERRPNFDTPPEAMTRENGWTIDGCRATLGQEPPGPPVSDGLFVRARSAIVRYDFSDPRIVTAHFDPAAPLLGRGMLLEMKVLGVRFLGGVRVSEVRDETADDRTVFAYRYDTLEGHFEQGFEWFRLTKEHATGRVLFEIEAHWRPGQFPTWWARIGFVLLGKRIRELWRRFAVRRMRRLAQQPAEARLAPPGRLAHHGDRTPLRTHPQS